MYARFGIVMLVSLVVMFLLPAPKTADEEPGTATTSAAEGGYPTPPMDLVVPPTPRSLARSSVTAGDPAPDTTDREA